MHLIIAAHLLQPIKFLNRNLNTHNLFNIKEKEIYMLTPIKSRIEKNVKSLTLIFVVDLVLQRIATKRKRTLKQKRGPQLMSTVRKSQSIKKCHQTCMTQSISIKPKQTRISSLSPCFSLFPLYREVTQ